MKTKGMSQVLSLIVAATVLMMAALTVIFMTTGSLGDFTSSVSGSGCSSTVKAKCAKPGIQTISVPQACIVKTAKGGERVAGLPIGASLGPQGTANKPKSAIPTDAYINCP